MDMFPVGQWVRGYLASDTLNTAAAIPLFDVNGNTLTFTAGRLIIEEIVIQNGATAANYTIFNDTNSNNTLDAGEELTGGALAVNAQFTFPAAGNDAMAMKMYGASNKNRLMIVATAASVGTKITVMGRIINS